MFFIYYVLINILFRNYTISIFVFLFVVCIFYEFKYCWWLFCFLFSISYEMVLLILLYKNIYLYIIKHNRFFIYKYIFALFFLYTVFLLFKVHLFCIFQEWYKGITSVLGAEDCEFKSHFLDQHSQVVRHRFLTPTSEVRVLLLEVLSFYLLQIHAFREVA